MVVAISAKGATELVALESESVKGIVFGARAMILSPVVLQVERL